MPIDSLSTDPRLYVETTWADSVRALPEYTYTGTGPSVMDWILEKFFDVLREVLDGRADSLTDFVGYAVVIGTLVLTVPIGLSALRRLVMVVLPQPLVGRADCCRV